VALCDVDEKQAGRSFQAYEKAKKYKDFRKMLDAEGRNIDAVIIATPDHMHGMAAMWSMERSKHVYVQKPLTRTVWEARQLMEAARKYKVATQMGNQGYSNEGTRQCAEMIWAGEIGDVTEVHAWTDRPMWPQGLTSIPAPSEVPGTLDWDLWLGIAPEPPVHRRRRRLPHAVRQLLSALQLARLLRLRLRRAGRYGLPHSGCAEYGAQTGPACQRGMYQQGGRKPVHVPEEIGHEVRVPCPGLDAAGHAVLV
jgi:hypothetical protein